MDSHTLRTPCYCEQQISENLSQDHNWSPRGYQESLMLKMSWNIISQVGLVFKRTDMFWVLFGYVAFSNVLFEYVTQFECGILVLHLLFVCFLRKTIKTFV